MKRIAIGLLFLLLFVGAAQAQAGPVYYYVVTAVDVNGFESAYSNQATATFGVGQKTASLSWTASVVPSGGAAIAGYNIYRSKTTGTGYVKINAALVTGVTYSDSFVPPTAPTGLTAPTS
jgi:hypothetical protein